MGKWIRKYTVSMKVPLVLSMILIGMIPTILQSGLLTALFQQYEIEANSIKVQNQCMILSNKMTRTGYLAADTKDPMLDNEMNNIADIFNGRIVIVDKNYKIIKDTFYLSEGKMQVSEEVIRCFQGENSNRYNWEKHYFAQTLPIYGSTEEKKIDGVLVVTASTEPILSTVRNLSERAWFYQIMLGLVLVMVIILIVKLLLNPFKAFQKALDKVANGALEEDITADTYHETKAISDAVKRTLKKLKDVDQSRQEFVSNVSHELKTPITSIRVLADSLMGMEDAPAELYREFMNDISDEIERENKIIDDLLELVKMDRSATKMNIEQVSVNALVELILKRLRPIAKERNIELIFESIREVMADVDEVKLSLALNNLVENAVKYNIEDGWVRVILDADHKFFYVRVADSGVGIPEEFQEHVFERFYRVDKARSRETGGTGLGLAITKNVILMHQGTIKVQSTEREGTTFMVQIPLNYISS